MTENGIQTMYRYMYEGEQVIGLVKNGTEVYHYQYGTSGDIVRICDAQGSVVARYNYDAWGDAVYIRRIGLTLRSTAVIIIIETIFLEVVI